MKARDFIASRNVDLPTLKILQSSTSEGSFSPGFQRLAEISEASCMATCSLSVDFIASRNVDLPTLKILQSSTSEGSFSPGFQRLAEISEASCMATCSLSVVRETGFKVDIVALFTGPTP